MAAGDCGFCGEHCWKVRCVPSPANVWAWIGPMHTCDAGAAADVQEHGFDHVSAYNPHAIHKNREVCPKVNPDGSRCARAIEFIPEGHGVTSGWYHLDRDSGHHPIPASWLR